MRLNYNFRKVLVGKIIGRDIYNKLNFETKKVMLLEAIKQFKYEMVIKYGSLYNYQKVLFKKLGYKTFNEYQQEWAKSYGFKSFYSYQLDLFKKRGFETYHKYKTAHLKKLGFKSKQDYYDKLAQDKGFKSQLDYLDNLARKRGFNNNTAMVRFKRKMKLQKEIFLTIPTKT